MSNRVKRVARQDIIATSFSDRSRPKLFVFEGPDGVGKTTLAGLLQKELERGGRAVDLVSFPGQEPGTLGAHIYQLYHKPQIFGIGRIPVITEQVLFTAAHADVIERRIIPAWGSGRAVVLDRYWWSTWVYATVGGLSASIRDRLLELELCIWNDVKPDCIFHVTRDEPIGSEHSTEKWRRLATLYDELKLSQKDKVKIVDVRNNAALERAFEVVCHEVGVSTTTDAGSGGDVT